MFGGYLVKRTPIFRQVLNRKLSFSITILLLVLITPFIIGTTAAQAPTVEWNKTYGDFSGEWFESVVQTSDGGYIAAGLTVSYGAGSDDGWLVKLNPSGVIVWNKTYGGGSSDIFESVVQTSDGGYIAAGRISSAGAGNTDGWLVKTHPDGTVDWNITCGGSDWDYFHSVVQTSDGGYIAAGRIASAGAGNDDGWLVKVNPTGGIVWNKTYGGGSYDYFRSVVQTSDGGYIAAGLIGSSGAGGEDGWLVKTYPDGSEEWTETFGGSANDRFYSVVQTSDGGYIAAGYTVSFGAGNNDGWLVKTYTNGKLDWIKTYGGSDYDAFDSVVQTLDAGYIATGRIGSAGDSSYLDGWLIKLNPNGDDIWNMTYGGSYWDRFFSVIQTSDGGYLTAGSIASAGAGWKDGWLVKLSAPTPLITTTCPTFTVDPCDCEAHGYQTPCTYWLLPGCDRPAPPTFNPGTMPTTTATTTAETTTATTTTTTTLTTTTTTATPITTLTTTIPPTSTNTTTTVTTTTPAPGMLIAFLCGLLVVSLTLRRIK